MEKGNFIKVKFYLKNIDTCFIIFGYNIIES